MNGAEVGSSPGRWYNSIICNVYCPSPTWCRLSGRYMCSCYV